MLAWMMGIALLAQVDGESIQKLNKIREEIRAGGYKQVAVCPRPICRSGEGESFASADVGPQGRVWCENLYNFLSANARDDGFGLTPSRSVSQHMAGFSLEDLSDPGKLRKLSALLNAPALVIVEVAYRPGTMTEEPVWTLNPKLYNLIENTETIVKPEKVTLSLSDWAFMGNSFEARRWKGDRLELVGFSEGLSLAEGLAMGLGAEQSQHNYLIKDRPHPLLSESTSLPYGIQIVVGNEDLEIKEIGDKLYVELNPGQTFGVRMQNDLDRPVLCALYIDGVNTVGQQFQHPLVSPPTDRWSLVPHYRGRIDGWFNRGLANGPQTIQPFRIVSKSGSVAAGFGQSVDGNFGMITAIFYTNGVEGINPAPSFVAARGTTQFAVGADQATAINVNFHDAKAGLILAAITVHYRTGEELNGLIDNPPKPGPSGLDNPPKPKPVKPNTPGEDEVFLPPANGKP